MKPLFSSKDPGQIIALDGVRAVSVLIVIGGHYGASIGVSPGFGVTVFFAISGFLITYLMLEEIHCTGTLSPKNFYLRRLFRLMPALFLFVLSAYSVWKVLGFKPRLSELWPALFYFQNYYELYWMEGRATLPFGPLWSLAVEEHYYLLYPVLVLACRRSLNGLLTAMAVLIVIISVWRAVVITQFQWGGHSYAATDCRIDSILWGALLAVTSGLSNGEKAIRALGHPIAMAGALIVLILVLGPLAWHPCVTVWRYDLLCPSLFIVFAGILFSAEYRRTQGILEMGMIRWLGKTSYPLYLWHGACLDAVDQLMGHEWFTVHFNLARLIGILATLVAANFSYCLVEKRFIALRRHFGSGVGVRRLPT